MKKKYAFILFIALAITSLAQTHHVAQPKLAMEYDIPSSWTVQEFFKNSWDESGGSSVCHCAGSISILKIPIAGTDQFDYIHMVAYPSDKKGQNAEMRRGVWQYQFVPIEDPTDSIKTSDLHWAKYVSKFIVHGGENRFKDCTVWKLETHKEKTYYTVYFWAKPTIFKEHLSDIEKIIQSFKSL